MKKLFALLALSLGLLGCTINPVGPSVHEEIFGTPRQVTKEVVGEYGKCSGVVIAPQVLLTAAHCISLFNKEDVLHVSDTVDLMLARTPLGCPCTHIGVEPQIDDSIVVAGFPLGAGMLFVTEGTVQAIQYIQELAVTFMFVSANAEPGNSGGGVFLKKDGVWYLVGIVVIKRSETNYMTGSITYQDLKAFLERYKDLPQVSPSS